MFWSFGKRSVEAPRWKETSPERRADELTTLLSRNLGGQHKLLSGVSRQADPVAAVGDLVRQFAGAEATAVIVFASPKYHAATLAKALADGFGDTPVFGCTTAGEITPLGYETGTLTGIAFPRRHFQFSTHLLSGLSSFSMDDGLRLSREIGKVLAEAPGGESEGWRSLALLLSDGLCRQEEALLSALEPGLAPIPIVGGSAGDGLSFGETFVIHEGKVHSDAALLALVRTDYKITELRFDHFRPTESRLVVTEADPARRLVREINAEPAAEAYARAVGCSVKELSPFTFATRPMLVRVGGRYHVRAIKQVEENNALSFLCAIDEGLVMTLGEATDIVTHLDSELSRIAEANGPPSVVLGFDCILRRLESEYHKKFHAVSDLLSRNRVIGFSTYGEQFHGMHVSHTFVGVAFHEPEPLAAAQTDATFERSATL